MTFEKVTKVEGAFVQPHNNASYEPYIEKEDTSRVWFENLIPTELRDPAKKYLPGLFEITVKFTPKEES